MSGQNFPNGSIGPGYPVNLYRAPHRQTTGPGSAPPNQAHTRLIAPNRGTIITCHPGTGPEFSSRANVGQAEKSITVPQTAPNLTVIPPGAGVLPANAVGGFHSQLMINTLFQSLLRGQVPATVSSASTLSAALPAANVTGYTNTMAPNGGAPRLTATCTTESIATASVVGGMGMQPNARGPVTTATTTTYQLSSSIGNMLHQSSANQSAVNRGGGGGGSSSSNNRQPAQQHDKLNHGRKAWNAHTSNAHSLQSSSPSQQQQQNHPTQNNSTIATTRVSVPVSSSLANPVDALFTPSNITIMQASTKDSSERKRQKLSIMVFLRWASVYTRSFRRERVSPWPHSQTEVDALHSMNWIIAPNGLLGIYSESPFLRPVLLLRRVQFASPATVLNNFPDPDNMVRTLRDLADSKVTKNTAFLPTLPRSAASVGFCTDFLSYVFTLDLDRVLVKILSEQMKAGPRRVGPEWRVILRLGWATSDFYVPPTNTPTVPGQQQRHRALSLESLPRCLNVRVAGRPVTLPDAIFHGGQAQRLGKRLRLSIDITDKLPIKPNNPFRNRFVDIEINWLHAPLEDQSSQLLDLVANGMLNPLLCHLIGLPMVQMSFDRVYSIPDLRTVFHSSTKPQCSVFDQPLIEGPFERDIAGLMRNVDGSMSDLHAGVLGTYDNCIPPTKCITADTAKSALKIKFQASADDDLCVTDGVNAEGDYIPICLLCPLTRTRIDLPVRSVDCEHLQCFDLTSYLTINRRRPRWACPICGVSAPFRDLRLDELFVSILENAQSASATFVHVDPNGQWKLAPEESTNSQNTDCSISEAAPIVKTDQCPPSTRPTLSPISPSAVVGAGGNPTTTTTVQLQKPTGDSNSAEPDVEIIILSDDDDDDEEVRVSEVANTMTPTAASTDVANGQPEMLTPTKREKSSTPSFISLDVTDPCDDSFTSTEHMAELVRYQLEGRSYREACHKFHEKHPNMPEPSPQFCHKVVRRFIDFGSVEPRKPSPRKPWVADGGKAEELEALMRTRPGITIRDAAKKLNVSKTTVFKLMKQAEQNKSNASAPTGIPTMRSDNPQTVEIDLTNDSSDDSDNEVAHENVPQTTTTTTASVTPQPPSNTVTGSDILASPMIEDERLRESQAVILVSPLLPDTINGLCSRPSSSDSNPSNATTGLKNPSSSSGGGNNLSRPSDPTATTADSLNYRHLFDTFSHQARKDHLNKLVNKPRLPGSSSMGAATAGTHVHSGKRSGVGPVRPGEALGSKTFSVATQPAALENPPDQPGLEMSDLSEPEDNLGGSSYSTFPNMTSGSRSRPRLWKNDKTDAFARLVQQRQGRTKVPRISEPTNSLSTSKQQQQQQQPRIQSLKRPRPCPKSKRRLVSMRNSAGDDDDEDDEDDDDDDDSMETSEDGGGSSVISQMSLVSPSDRSAESSCTSSDDDDAEDSAASDSSDDRWSPSRKHLTVGLRGRRRPIPPRR